MINIHITLDTIVKAGWEAKLDILESLYIGDDGYYCEEKEDWVYYEVQSDYHYWEQIESIVRKGTDYVVGKEQDIFDIYWKTSVCEAVYAYGVEESFSKLEYVLACCESIPDITEEQILAVKNHPLMLEVEKEMYKDFYNYITSRYSNGLVKEDL